MISDPLKILITAGPTRQPIDSVRFISNYSSGQTGIALASAAHAGGHAPTLLLASAVHPCDVQSVIQEGTVLERFDSVTDLQEKLEIRWSDHDVLIMAAAVADYRPRTTTSGKLPRDEHGLTLQLESTPDLVATMAARKRPDQIVIAFALEASSHLVSRALQKLHRKGVDAIVANSLATLNGPSISPLWMTRAGRREAPGAMTKQTFGTWLIHEIEKLVGR